MFTIDKCISYSYCYYTADSIIEEGLKTPRVSELIVISIIMFPAVMTAAFTFKTQNKIGKLIIHLAVLPGHSDHGQTPLERSASPKRSQHIRSCTTQKRERKNV